MPWPECIVRYKDGSTRAITRATLAQDWADMPIHGIDRIDFDPPYFGATGGFSLVVSGGDAYWGYTEGANTVVFGVRSYEWDATGTSWDLTKPQWYEFLFDKRDGKPRTEREATGIPPQALVRYAD